MFTRLVNYVPEVWILPSTDSGAVPRRLISEVGGYAPAFSTDGQRVAFMWQDGETRKAAVWVAASDGSGAREIAALPGEGFRNRDVTWSPAGRRLYVGGEGRDSEALLEVDIDSGRVTEIGPNGIDLVWVSGDQLFARTRDLDARRHPQVDASGGGTTSSWTLPIDPSDLEPWRLTELRVDDGELASVKRVGEAEYHVNIDGLDAVSCT